jgi:hypothetical protein
MAALYYAIYLNEESKQKLLAAVPPIHKNVFAEHITVAFKPSPSVAYWLERARSAEYIEFTVISVVLDDKGQAVRIEEPLRVDDGVPHITISCAENTKPVYSNGMFATLAPAKLAVPLKLRGTLEPNRK